MENVEGCKTNDYITLDIINENYIKIEKIVSWILKCVVLIINAP